MSGLQIRYFPQDNILRLKAKKITQINSSIQHLIDQMIETLQEARGIGLAAPQVGVLLRVVVIQLPSEEPMTFINPEITSSSGEQCVTEACLSVPGYYGEITRPAELAVKGKNNRGEVVKVNSSGLMAQALAHEIDHLNGILYIDRIKNLDNLYKIEVRVVPAQ